MSDGGVSMSERLKGVCELVSFECVRECVS